MVMISAMEPLETNVTTLHGEASAEASATYRTPPHNTEIEAALLGAVLTNNRAFDKMTDFLRPDHFFEPVHARIFDAIAKLIERGQVASPQTLRHLFESDDLLREVGGPQYLYELAASVVSVINAGDYAKMVHDLYLRRELIGLGEDVVNDAYAGDIEISA